jgi:hypothetical protein
MRAHYLMILLLSTLIFTACKSNEEKVAEVIRNEMFKTLYDYSSYEPIETLIDSAFTKIYRDSTILFYAALIKESIAESSLYLDKMEEANSSLRIWADSYSSYGYSKYKEAKDEFNDSYQRVLEIHETAGNYQKEIKSRAENFQTSFCGWQVEHKFRCKTKGGNYDLATFIYLFDIELKKITYQEDVSDEDLKHLRKLIDEALE